MRLARRHPGFRAVIVLACLVAAAAVGLLAQHKPAYDLVIRGGRVVDGTGSPWARADVAVVGDTIAAVAWRIDAPAARVIDASGMIVNGQVIFENGAMTAARPGRILYGPAHSR